MVPHLTVIGGSSLAQVLAAWLSAAHEREVWYVGDLPHERWTPTVVRHGRRRPAQVARAAAPRDGDLVIVAGDTTAAVIGAASGQGGSKSRTVVVPGGAGGALRAGVAAELPGFVALGAIEGDDVAVSAVKERLPIGVTDASIVPGLAAWFPESPVVDVLSTGLANLNHVMHPALATTNLARIANGEPYRFYREGLSEAGLALVLGVDRERRAIATALGVDTADVHEWYRRFYGEQGYEGGTLGEALIEFPALDSSRAPATLDHRYLVDDVRFGIAVYEALGRALGVPTRVVTGLINVIEEATQKDLRDEAPRQAQLLLATRGVGVAG